MTGSTSPWHRVRTEFTWVKEDMPLSSAQDHDAETVLYRDIGISPLKRPGQLCRDGSRLCRGKSGVCHRLENGCRPGTGYRTDKGDQEVCSYTGHRNRGIGIENVHEVIDAGADGVA